MSEPINLFDPRLTMQLGGFSGRAATTTLTDATATSLTVSGIFQAAEDFAVLELYNAYDFYAHLRCKPLPRTDLSGLTLEFDLEVDAAFEGNVRIGSKKFPSVAWDSLIFYFGSSMSAWMVRLSEYATVISGSDTNSSASLTISGSGNTGVLHLYFRDARYTVDLATFGSTPSAGDIMTAFEDLINSGSSTHGSLYGPNYGTSGSSPVGYLSATHSGGTLTVEFVDWGIDGNADRLYHSALSGSSWSWSSPQGVRFTGGADTRKYHITLPFDSLDVRQQPGDAPTSVTDTGTFPTNPMLDLRKITMTFAPRFENIELGLERGAFLTSSVSASAAGTVEDWSVDDTTFFEVGKKYYVGDGTDEERIEVVLVLDGTTVKVRRGVDSSSPASWGSGVRILSLSPISGVGSDIEWKVYLTNIAVTTGSAALKVGGPDEGERLEETSNAVYAGYWEEAPYDWWSGGHAKRTAPSSSGDNRTVTVTYQKNQTHDLYIGTKFAKNCGKVEVTIDGGTPTVHDLYLNTFNELVVMLKIGDSLAAGVHTVQLKAKFEKNAASAGYYFYYDYLWPLVPGDVPDAPWDLGNASLSIDFDTDHGIKKPPYWLQWMQKKLGFNGWRDVYLGVFWNNKRRRISQTYPQCSLTFTGSPMPGDLVSVTFDSTTLSFAIGYGSGTNNAENLVDVVSRIRATLNAAFSGIWCDNDYGTSTTLRVRSKAPSFTFTTVSISGSFDPSSTLSLAKVDGTPDIDTAGAEGDWELIDSISPVMTQGARDWFRDLASQFAADGHEASWAFSMECYVPPVGMRARYLHLNGSTVEEGKEVFLDVPSYHMHFGTRVRAYLAQMFKEAADEISAAGLLPVLQFGETQWWYFPNNRPEMSGSDWYDADGGMAFYDQETIDAFAAEHGHQIHPFLENTDDPSGDPAHPHETANWLKNRVWAYCAHVMGVVQATHPEALFECLWPMDANFGPNPASTGDPLFRHLNARVNLPDQWKTASGGLAYFVSEAYDYDVRQKNLEKAMRAAMYPYTLGRPESECRFLLGVFGTLGYAPGDPPLSGEFWSWQDSRLGRNGGDVSLWAFDQFCLHSRPVPIPRLKGTRGSVKSRRPNYAKAGYPLLGAPPAPTTPPPTAPGFNAAGGNETRFNG